MAEDKPNPLRLSKQPKLKIYQCLFNLNNAFEAIGREIEVLDDWKAVPIETLWRYRLRAEEIRAGLNHRLLGFLAGRELAEWTLYGKEIREPRITAITPEDSNSASPPVVPD
jgi:hypothetical protein